ncbi:YtxH domain-containing protein [Lapidilactobacillus wuchangensis]|uniref:YtxH domain-containing protein n=1 Tax=Lapidilactobacillus wuchangensis TaxID=2486001 RepID=UPI000F7A18FD|nr:YtxH domain-containing protein [Lapidilactobacillus wuchangensis]
MKHSFRKGLISGAIAGTAYILLTTKKTGLQRQHHIRQYFDDLTTSTKNLTQSVQHFKNALGSLQKEFKGTAAPTIAALQKDIEDYQFQMQPRVEQLTEDATKLQDKLNDLQPTDDLQE